MSVAEKLQTIAANQQRVYDAGFAAGQAAGGDTDAAYQEGYDAGKQAEYDAFWDKYQYEGKNTPVYSYAFAGPGWSDVNFKPKYNIAPRVTFSNYMFASSAITNLKSILENLGISLNFRWCTSFVNVFQDSNIAEIGEVNTIGASSLGTLFYNARHLSTVDALILKSDGSQTIGNCFTNTTALANITITGCIGNAINMRYSPLSKASIESVVNALSSTSTNKTATLNQTAVNGAFETAEGAADGSTSAGWLALVASKPNWTITLV